MPVLLRTDIQKNRAYLTLAGLVADEELRQGVDQYIAQLGTLRPGFTTVTDLSSCRPLSQTGVAEVRRAAQACVGRGIQATARVVQQTTVAMLQFQRVSREEGYTAFTVPSLMEAERLLDEEVRLSLGAHAQAAAALP
ncbi:MAG: hypothetical protein L0Y66_09795 [Myxococcaceae bacterium]|nr:hypothetical protein [Myxococcaceae bacterium]MCI0670000.1 hypothetical protein [Myxococcaceae bacterium]